MDKVRIGVREYDIIEFSKEDVDKNVFEFNVSKEDGDLLGRIDSSKNCIYISKDQCEDAKNQTILHESLHAIWEQMGRDNNEDLINGLAEQLYALLVQNYFPFSKKEAFK